MPYYENQEIRAGQRSINIKEFIIALLKHWYIIIISVIICGSLAFIYSEFIATPMYRSTAKLYVINKQAETLSTSELSVSTALAKDYAELINDYSVLKTVAEELDNKYSVGQLSSFLTIVNPESTRFLELTVTSPNAVDSKKIVDSICTVSQEKIISIMGVDRVTIVREGNVSSAPSSPNVKKNTVTGILAGVVLSAAIILIIYYLNDTFNTADDVERVLKLNVLATIPYSTSNK